MFGWFVNISTYIKWLISFKSRQCISIQDPGCCIAAIVSMVYLFQKHPFSRLSPPPLSLCPHFVLIPVCFSVVMKFQFWRENTKFFINLKQHHYMVEIIQRFSFHCFFKIHENRLTFFFLSNTLSKKTLNCIPNVGLWL